MAVTAMWAIKGRLSQVIDYVMNPEKTTEEFLPDLIALHAVNGVVEYAADEVKTEKRSYVSCLNCTERNAAQQFLSTKRFWRKVEDKRVCYHGYQSFQEGEVTAEQAHALGVALAKELWGSRFEVVVATHCNTNHYHNHFVVNSVSFADGKKFYNSKADYRRMREVSDRLCREHGLSVLERPGGRKKSYSEWKAEQDGVPTQRSTIRADIDRAVASATTEQGFIRTMQEMGYQFKTRRADGERLKYPALKPPGAKGFFRFHRLGDGYDLDEIIDRVYENMRKRVPFPEAEQEAASRLRQEMWSHPTMKCKGLRALYFRYCYELHIIVKHPASVKRVSFLLREDVKKMERYIAQTRLLGREGIDTGQQLEAYQNSLEDRMEQLTQQRRELRNHLKAATRAGNGEVIDRLKPQIADLSVQIKAARDEIGLCSEIKERSKQVERNLIDINNQIQEGEKTNEYSRRFGRPDRENVPQWP